MVRSGQYILGCDHCVHLYQPMVSNTPVQLPGVLYSIHGIPATFHVQIGPTQARLLAVSLVLVLAEFCVSRDLLAMSCTRLILRPGGPSHVLPGLIMFSIFGYVGQSIYNTMDKRDDPRGAAQRVGFWQRIGNSRFSPMKVLSDEEYKRMLQEKMLRIDAEIAIIDENIDSLRQRQGEITENAPASGCE